MDDRLIFLIGGIVTLLFLAGIFLTAVEVRKMDLKPEEYGAKAEFEPPRTTSV